uniref:Uncharacterized protein n=1 Tax=Arion vulgaris TaxID=1028688 RepID=A0A0B7ACU3_9EUPU
MPKVIRSTLEGPLEELPRKVVGCRRCTHILLFLFLFGNDIADFVSDWLFFTDVVIAESGLVYGPPEPVAVWFLLVFSIIGTFTFIFECINLWWEFFRGNPWLDSDWLSAVVIWIEDVPQVIISLSLILCREEPISVFQLVKAIVIMISVVIRIVVTSVKYCNKKAIKSRHHVKIKAVIMLGIIVEAFAVGGIFFLTQTERNNAGDISYRVPSTVIEDGYDDQRYFRDVSIFFHDRNLANQNPQTNSMVDWIRLATIYSIREGDQEASSFRVEYEQAGGSLNKLAISERDYDNWTLSECYSIDPNTKNITQVSNTICSQPGFFSNSTSLFMKLTFEKPGSIFKRKIFGDVHMNVKKLQNGVCTSVNDYADSIESSISNNIPLTFHYYRTNETLHPGNVKHLLQSGIPSFYTSSDIIDVSVVWKTGWKDCESSGHVAPILDKDLTLTCL